MVRGRRNPLHESLGQRLKRARQAAGLSRRALSLSAGLADTVVGQAEAGRVPLIDTTERLALALGVSSCWLAFGALGLRPFQDKVPRNEQVEALPTPSPGPVPSTAALTSAGVGARLRLARGERSRNALGLASGLSGQSIANIEDRGRVPTLATLERLAAALRVAPGWLAYGVGEGPARFIPPASFQGRRGPPA